MKKVIMLFFAFSISLNLIAQKQNKLDTLNVEQLNVYLDKAVKLRNAGIKATFSGVGVAAAGYIITTIWLETTSLEGWESFVTLAPFAVGTLLGIPTAIVGALLWINGSYKKSKAEIAIMKFNIMHDNSMALGLGITIRF